MKELNVILLATMWVMVLLLVMIAYEDPKHPCVKYGMEKGVSVNISNKNSSVTYQCKK